MESGRFILIISGYQQNIPQELTDPSLEGKTVAELGALGWYQVQEIDKPEYNPITERLNEYNYTINVSNCTATPLYEVETKYDMSNTEYVESCPVCVAELLESDTENRENPVRQALAKGKLTIVDTI